ncbi:MAG TPA: serine/threonine-protein kinase, partial [Acidobacteriota bacterium]|nr:serine/threonine-protein kinase [Acidobacteriota bacterium]
MQHKSLGKYQIEGTLGKGSMGVIYIAFDTALERKVAIKTMTSELMTDPQLRKRFNTEAKAAGSLRHANIITIFELGEEQKTPYIVMELLSGTDLKTMMQSNQRWPYRKLLNIAIQTSKGLHYAHQHGVVHRDIKPANIFICSDGLVKILDFGVAHVLTSTMTQAGMLLGSLGYMPPEQIIGQKVDGRVDQYSLGVILYELITGNKPFLEKDIPTTIQAILNKPPIPIRTIRDDCPAALETAVLRSLQKDREKRFPNLDEFCRVLSQLYATVAADDTLQLQHTVTADQAAPTKAAEKKGSDTKSWLTLNELLHQSREMAKDGRLTEAIGLLKEHNKTYQHDPEFQTYYRQLRQEKESFDKRAMFQKHYQDALRLLDEDNFQLARLELETLLKLDPSSPQISQLDRLISTRESAWQINEWAEEGEKLANRGSWDELAAHIDAGNRLFGKVKDYIVRREHLENRREKSDIASLFEQLIPLEESGRLEEAVALLRPLLRVYSKNRELVEKYNTLMATKLEQDRQESMQHFVSDQIKIVNTLLKSDQTEQAQIYLMKLLDKFPGTAAFEEKMIE